MAAAWFKGVQRRICLDYNDTVNKLFHKCFMNSASIVTIATIVTCPPEPITAELVPMTHLKKEADLYLQRCDLNRDFASSSVLFCAPHQPITIISLMSHLQTQPHLAIHEKAN